MKLKISAIVALALASSASLGAAEKMTTGTINVISTTPLPSIGLPLNIIPANIQIFDSKDLRNQPGVTFADQLMNNAQGITFNEIQGNPWQPDVSFRGFSASPLAGTPQGMSVFVDGVRVNEPFGDTVHWDLVPNFAIQGMQVVPGSNPVYGLNTLGGAIALQTKDGRNNQGAALEAEAGSWGRKRGLAQFGGVSKDGSVDYFLGAQHTTEDGWRKHSPSHINQTFGKVGWQNEKTKINLSYMGAYNNMIGNGLTPIDMLGGNRDEIHTSPDITKNYLNHFALNAAHWLNNDVMLSANAYHRTSNRNTVNGDANDDFNSDLIVTQAAIDDGSYTGGLSAGKCDTNLVSGAENENCAPGIMNRSRLKSRSLGFNMQAAFNQPVWGMKNQFIAGVGYDLQRTKFNQTEQPSEAGNGDDITTNAVIGSWFDSARKPINLEDEIEGTVNLGGRSRTASLFATDTLSLNQYWHVTASARYNHTKVKNRDHLNPSGSQESLSGDHNFNRVNPSLGLTFTPTETLSVFGSYSESNRAPTSIELGCANPDVPCKLPNAMASDPPLNQVVAKTYDAGLRGKISDNLKWNASVYRTMNHDDIHFINSSSRSGALGYFDNVGRTKRQGLDLGLSGAIDKFFFRAGYSYISAKYDTDVALINEINSEAIDVGTEGGSVINARKGNYLAGIPKHQFKLRAQYEITPQWLVGSNVIYYASQYVQGNENNAHNSNTTLNECNDPEDGHAKCIGKLSGYAVVNLDTQYNVGQGWRVFAKAVNIFDKDYYTGGRLAETMFTPGGTWGPEDRGVTAVVPGAPRAAWVGVRYEFGGAPEAK